MVEPIPPARECSLRSQASQRVALFAQPRDRPLSDEITSLIAPRCCSPLLLFLCSRWRSLRALVRVSCSAAASLLPTAAHHPLLLLFLLASGWGAPYRWHSALALLRLAPSHTSAMATSPDDPPNAGPTRALQPGPTARPPAPRAASPLPRCSGWPGLAAARPGPLAPLASYMRSLLY